MKNQYQLLPDLTEDEYAALKEDIESRGVMVPVEYDENGNILDGYHRVKICEELGLDYPVIVRKGWTEEQKITHALSLNLNRRHLDKKQRKELEAELRLKGWSYRKIAAVVGVSQMQVARDMAGVTNVTPDHVEGLDGKSYPAQKRKPEAVQVLFGDDVKGITEKARELSQAKRDKRRQERVEKLMDITENNKPLDGIGLFPVLYADPPWEYDFPISDSRRIENQYPTMPIEEICKLPVRSIANDDAIIFLWVPPSFIHKGLMVLDAWGFQFRTTMVWVKPSIGPGQWVRQRHELLLIGVKGDIPTPKGKDKPDSVIEAPREEHSKKPEIMYQIIEKMYPELRKVELFSRNKREGWESWGNQV